MRKYCRFLCLLLFFATIPRDCLHNDGIVAHDAGKEEQYTNTFIITMVDYSKWDKLDYGDESEDDGEDDKNVPLPAAAAGDETGPTDESDDWKRRKRRLQRAASFRDFVRRQSSFKRREDDERTRVP